MSVSASSSAAIDVTGGVSVAAGDTGIGVGSFFNAEVGVTDFFSVCLSAFVTSVEFTVREPVSVIVSVILL